jgi:hypothetical protein
MGATVMHCYATAPQQLSYSKIIYFDRINGLQ